MSVSTQAESQQRCTPPPLLLPAAARRSLPVPAAPFSSSSSSAPPRLTAGFHGVTFDGAHVAGTNLEIACTMGAVVDSSR